MCQIAITERRHRAQKVTPDAARNREIRLTPTGVSVGVRRPAYGHVCSHWVDVDGCVVAVSRARGRRSSRHRDNMYMTYSTYVCTRGFTCAGRLKCHSSPITGPLQTRAHISRKCSMRPRAGEPSPCSAMVSSPRSCRWIGSVHTSLKLYRRAFASLGKITALLR